MAEVEVGVEATEMALPVAEQVGSTALPVAEDAANTVASESGELAAETGKKAKSVWGHISDFFGMGAQSGAPPPPININVGTGAPAATLPAAEPVDTPTATGGDVGFNLSGLFIALIVVGVLLVIAALARGQSCTSLTVIGGALLAAGGAGGVLWAHTRPTQTFGGDGCGCE